MLRDHWCQTYWPCWCQHKAGNWKSNDAGPSKALVRWWIFDNWHRETHWQTDKGESHWHTPIKEAKICGHFPKSFFGTRRGCSPVAWPAKTWNHWSTTVEKPHYQRQDWVGWSLGSFSILPSLAHWTSFWRDTEQQRLRSALHRRNASGSVAKPNVGPPTSRLGYFSNECTWWLNTWLCHFDHHCLSRNTILRTVNQQQLV